MQSKVKKFLTLNTHSWQGTDGVPCLQYVSEMIRKEQPDVIAFQEVNQRADGEKAGPGLLEKIPFCTLLMPNP